MQCGPTTANEMNNRGPGVESIAIDPNYAQIVIKSFMQTSDRSNGKIWNGRRRIDGAEKRFDLE